MKSIRQALSSIFLQIGVRLLSCETPDDNGVVVFSDNIVHGVVIGMNFFVKDLSARGFQKKYSLAIISDDHNMKETFDAAAAPEFELLANLNEIVSFFQALVDAIKSDHDKMQINTKALKQTTKTESSAEDTVEPCMFPQVDYIKLHQNVFSVLLHLADQRICDQVLVFDYVT